MDPSKIDKKFSNFFSPIIKFYAINSIESKQNNFCSKILSTLCCGMLYCCFPKMAVEERDLFLANPDIKTLCGVILITLIKI